MSKKAYGLKILQNNIYVKEYFYVFFSAPKNVKQAQNNFMTICLKDKSEEYFLFNGNVNATLKFIEALGGHSGTQVLRGRSALRQLRHLSTRAFKALGHLRTQGTEVLGYSDTQGTQTLGHSRHFIQLTRLWEFLDALDLLA